MLVTWVPVFQVITDHCHRCSRVFPVWRRCAELRCPGGWRCSSSSPPSSPSRCSAAAPARSAASPPRPRCSTSQHSKKMLCIVYETLFRSKFIYEWTSSKGTTFIEFSFIWARCAPGPVILHCSKAAPRSGTVSSPVGGTGWMENSAVTVRLWVTETGWVTMMRHSYSPLSQPSINNRSRTTFGIKWSRILDV